MTSESFHCSTPVKIRFRDLDAFGHVNNAVYFTFMEMARVEYFTQWACCTARRISFAVLHHRRSDVPVQSAAFDMETPLIVQVRVSRLGNSSFDMEYRFVDEVKRRGDGDRAHGASHFRLRGQVAAFPCRMSGARPSFDLKAYDTRSDRCASLLSAGDAVHGIGEGAGGAGAGASARRAVLRADRCGCASAGCDDAARGRRARERPPRGVRRIGVVAECAFPLADALGDESQLRKDLIQIELRQQLLAAQSNVGDMYEEYAVLLIAKLDGTPDEFLDRNGQALARFIRSQRDEFGAGEIESTLDVAGALLRT